MNALQSAIFLDRDGTLIHDVGYLQHPEGVELLPGVAEALRAWRRRDRLLIVVSNQSGIGRGLISWESHLAVHRRFIECFANEGVRFDDIRYCPHAPWEQCRCRKPQAETLLQLAQVWGIDLAASVMIGDKASDVLTGQRAGCRTILLAGDAGVLPPLETPADWVVRGLPECVACLREAGDVR